CSLVLVMLNSCYFGKHLDETRYIAVTDEFSPYTGNSTSFVYINNYTISDYESYYLTKLTEELSYYNATVVDISSQRVDYTLVIKQLNLKESTKSEVVDDPASEYHGQSYELIVCDADVSFSLYKGRVTDDKLIDHYTAGASKEEKLTNNRNLGDYMFGSNKDNSQYRHKLLSDDIFKDLTEKCANRTTAKITKKISK
ncbi:MAG: hypothetical protein ABIJ16_08800, partial [Bacteroidota bacterium]